MPLCPADFVAQRVNWDSKAANLASLAEELELGLDSFILVDDNPKEVQETQAGAPQVLLLIGPASIGKTTLALDLAAALLCAAGDDEARPCRACRACRLVASGTHQDLHRRSSPG